MARMTIFPFFALLAASSIVLLVGNAPGAFGQAASSSEAVQLTAGCSNVTLTWPDGTPAATAAAAVNPSDALTGIWRLDAAARRFQGWSPAPRTPNDFATVNRLEPAFICMREAGTLTRPALPDGVGVSASPTAPPSPQGQGVCNQSSIEATGNVIAGLDATRKRELTSTVVAIRTFGLPERRAVEIVLYHLPSGSQAAIDAQGRELRREICSAVGEQELAAILHDPTLLAKALELAQ